MQTYLILSFIIGLYLLRRYLQFRRLVDSIHDFPGFRTVLINANFFLRKRRRGITPGNLMPWDHKHQDFVDFGSDVFSALSVWPLKSIFYVADAEVLKDITSSRIRFQKPLELYTVLTVFGNNIVVTEGDEWKRHRKITAPAFSERNSRLVWDESMHTILGLFENIWGERNEVVIDNITDLTVPIGLFIIGAAGFGRRISWSDDITVPPGHVVAFKDALHTVSTDIFIKAVFPTFVLNWSPFKRVRKFKVAYDELEKYMIEMIHARKTAEQKQKEEQYDLFSSLLDANEDVDGKTAKLFDSEVLGNIFIFLIAGHETTAHSLAYTFIMLALHQDEQEILYQHVKGAFEDGRIPGYEESGKLSYALAVFLETLRMFPPVISIPKYATEDVTLVTRSTSGAPVHVAVPQGTRVNIHVAGLHYNPRYWEDPHTFKPARFLGDWPRDAFLPFSGGARSCLGRKFSETEGVAILSLLISRYRIEVKEEPQFAAETFAERKTRLLRSESAITLYPVRAPLVFKRR